MSNLQLGYSGVELVSQGTGYGLLIGLGVFFCGVILVAVKVQRLYLAEDSGTSEMFMVANRTVGTGLTAAAVFSSWMWINETVFAAAMCYRFGLAVPMVRGSLDPAFINPLLLADHISLTSNTVVGKWPLLSDRSDGSPGCVGKNPGTLRAYFARDYPAAIRQDRARRVYHPKPLQQRIWMCFYDLKRRTAYSWLLGHAHCRRNHSNPSWR